MPPKASQLFQQLIKGSRLALSRSVTLVESSNMNSRPEISQLMQLVYKYNQDMSTKDLPTFRLGISGPPGAGKSTFINAFASFLLTTNSDSKVSILTVEPSSPQTGGSLMADSTRMEALSQFADAERVFVRSSPTSGHLGGVHRRTPYAVQLAEAAGFNITLVETVGSGQSEVLVSDMVDCFLVLIPPASGDDFQAIKKGIMEMADIVAVTRNDTIFEEACRRTYFDYLSAMKAFPLKRTTRWKPVTTRISSKTGDGIPGLWDKMLKYQQATQENGSFFVNRQKQFENLYLSEVEKQLLERVYGDSNFSELSNRLKEKIAAGEIWPVNAAEIFVSEIFKHK